jgi:hypothetical protein
MELTRHPYVTAGVATAATGLIAVTPVVPPPLELCERAVELLTGEEEITLDLVRHAQPSGSAAYLSKVGSFLPGNPLSETGQEQAQALGTALAQQGPYAGIYAGDNIRMPETAAPLADQLDMHVQLLPGLDEIAGGIYNADPLLSPGGILYNLTLIAWVFGLDFVPMPGAYVNGVAFDESFSGAVQTIYDNTISADGSVKDVAVSGEAALVTWALMNAENPDLSFFAPHFLNAVIGGDVEAFLPTTGIVVLQGDPEDGWTIVSWNGQPVPQDPGLLTQLVVDVRDLISAPQIAAYNIYEAVLGSDPTTITNAIQNGVDQVGAAIVQFPLSVINDIFNAVGTAGSQNVAADLAGLLAGDFDPASISSLLDTLAADLPAVLLNL